MKYRNHKKLDFKRLLAESSLIPVVQFTGSPHTSSVECGISKSGNRGTTPGESKTCFFPAAIGTGPQKRCWTLFSNKRQHQIITNMKSEKKKWSTLLKFMKILYLKLLDHILGHSFRFTSFNPLYSRASRTKPSSKAQFEYHKVIFHSQNQAFHNFLTHQLTDLPNASLVNWLSNQTNNSTARSPSWAADSSEASQ